MEIKAPRVSVIMAFHNAGDFIDAAMASVQAQTLSDLELILSDDGSTDGSRARAEAAAAHDPRLRVVSGPSGGPAAARNRALDIARGHWIAIVDADDLLHPARLERLLHRAEALNVDIVGDDLVHFGAETGRSLLQPLDLFAPWRPTVEELLTAETRKPPVALGYLKPLMRRDAIGTLRYRPELRIGEDFDFLLRLCLSGAQLAVVPEAFYLYRRHGQSISHRLSEPSARAMIAALDRLADEPLEPDAARALQARRLRLDEDADFARLVAHLKSGRISAAAGSILRRPGLLNRLWRSFSEGRRRVRAPDPAVDDLLLSAEPSRGAVPAIQLPGRAEDWRLADVIAVVRATNDGTTRIRAVGHAGLEALGYVPGWSEAVLVAPGDGWSEAEARLISAIPWPLVQA